MKLRHLIYVVIAVCGVALMAGMGGCANIIPPTGGPRDSLPPVLLNASPADSTRSFQGKKIVLNFDEFVQVDNVQQNLLVSPVPLIPPTVESRLRTLTITMRDTLKPNTTYALDFGNSIKDFNEGNVLRNFTYVFSTGARLDSLQLGGRVTIAETGKTDSTLIVMLYQNTDDSAVLKERPRYIARVDSSGNFLFRYLEPGSFALYAVKDDGARRYQSKTALFAFYDSTVTSQSQRRNLMLYAFIPKDTVAKPAQATTAPAKKTKQPPSPALKIESNLNNNELDLLSDLEIRASARLYHLDTTKIRLVKDSLPVTALTVRPDTSGRKLIVKTAWTENARYQLVIDTAFASDSAGRHLLKNDTLVFQTRKESEYGLVRFRFLHLDLARHPVLQFIQGEDVKYSYVFRGGNEFYAKLFAPGDYELRIVFDDNQNGVWDTGEFFGQHRQPERVLLIPRKVTVKANWDNEIDIQL